MADKPAPTGMQMALMSMLGVNPQEIMGFVHGIVNGVKEMNAGIKDIQNRLSIIEAKLNGEESETGGSVRRIVDGSAARPEQSGIDASGNRASG